MRLISPMASDNAGKSLSVCMRRSNTFSALCLASPPGSNDSCSSLRFIVFATHHSSRFGTTGGPCGRRVFTLSPTARASLGTASARLGEDALFLPPVLAASLHGDPIEEVLFLRDEVANLVWAVERLAPALDGSALNRAEIYNRREREAPEPAAEGEESPAGELRYLLATTTPDHWIPFLPARIDPSLPDIRLRRAKALLEQLDPAAGGLPAFSRPLGRILEPERQDLSLFEEEVPRSGIFLRRCFQYARWLDGATYLWLARTKGQGKGESTAGLYFDQVE